MKHLLIIFLFISSNLFSQTPDKNFSIKENKIVWQKIFEGPYKKEELIKQLHKELNSSTNNNFTNKSVDYESLGFSTTWTPMYLNGKFKGNYTVDFKENKYRVTITNIETILNISIDFGGIESKPEYTVLEKIALKKDNTEFKKSFKKKAATILDHNFTTWFTYKKPTKEDW